MSGEWLDRPGAVRLDSVRGEVAFEEVSFGYEPGHPVLDRVSFRVPAGSSLAIVGPSGAGKTTIADLLFRLYRPESGRVCVDGHDLQGLKLRTLLHGMALVPQDCYLFNGTVGENIRYGDLTATDDDVEQAARLVHADAFIKQMPDGYNNEVGEAGVRLSVGQRQLLSFARALVANPKILVLDEATANIDSYTERQIQLAMERLLKGRTAIVIAHRLATVRGADRIIVLRDGEIVGVDWRMRLQKSAITRVLETVKV